jgi:hypothetical protein
MKILRVPPLGPGMPFLDSDTCAKGGYLFLSRFSSLYDAIHGWMMGRMDAWMDESHDEKASRKTTTTSFTIWGVGEIIIEIAREKIIDGDGDGWIDHERKPDPRGMEMGLDVGHYSSSTPGQRCSLRHLDA